MATQARRTNAPPATGGNPDHLRYLLTAYLFDNLSAAGRAEVEDHLAACAECRAELEKLRGTLSAVKAAFAVEQREYVFEARRRERVLAAAASGSRWRQLAGLNFGRFSWRLTALAGLLLLLIVGGLLLPTLGRARYAAREAHSRGIALGYTTVTPVTEDYAPAETPCAPAAGPVPLSRTAPHEEPTLETPPAQKGLRSERESLGRQLTPTDAADSRSAEVPADGRLRYGKLGAQPPTTAQPTPAMPPPPSVPATVAPRHVPPPAPPRKPPTLTPPAEQYRQSEEVAKAEDAQRAARWRERSQEQGAGQAAQAGEAEEAGKQLFGARSGGGRQQALRRADAPQPAPSQPGGGTVDELSRLERSADKAYDAYATKTPQRPAAETANKRTDAAGLDLADAHDDALRARDSWVAEGELFGKRLEEQQKVAESSVVAKEEQRAANELGIEHQTRGLSGKPAQPDQPAAPQGLVTWNLVQPEPGAGDAPRRTVTVVSGGTMAVAGPATDATLTAGVNVGGVGGGSGGGGAATAGDAAKSLSRTTDENSRQRQSGAKQVLAGTDLVGASDYDFDGTLEPLTIQLPAQKQLGDIRVAPETLAKARLGDHLETFDKNAPVLGALFEKDAGLTVDGKAGRADASVVRPGEQPAPLVANGRYWEDAEVNKSGSEVRKEAGYVADQEALLLRLGEEKEKAPVLRRKDELEVHDVRDLTRQIPAPEGTIRGEKSDKDKAFEYFYMLPERDEEAGAKSPDERARGWGGGSGTGVRGDRAAVAARERLLRSYRHYHAENAKLAFADFIRRPLPLPPPELTDEGLDEDEFIAKYGVRPFVDAARDHFSTFGLDVDTAAYTHARQALRQGKLPEPESVRTEEFVNYFKQPYEVPGDETFGVFAEGMPAPFAQPGVALLKIGIKSREPRADERKPAVLTFVVDTSGSMARDERLETVRDALASLVASLAPEDSVCIVGFSSQAQLLLPRTQARQQARIMEAIQRLEPSGGTNVEAGLDLGYRLADEAYSADAVNRLILCSDGVANVGAQGPDELLKLVEVFAARGIDLAAVGFGKGRYNDALMQRLADRGNGSCHFVDALPEAQRIFHEQIPPHLNVLARDAKAQVEFDPTVVARYRLLGYEKRKIADKDFRNDKIDAGEIGHATLVTALYEIQLRPGAYGPLGKVYLRWKDAAYRHLPVVERNYPLGEGLIAARIANASPELRFLACVAEFAELLRGSRWAADGSYGAVLAQLARLPAEFQERPECQELSELISCAQRLTERQWVEEIRR